MLKIEIIAVGTRPPAWINEGVSDYADRLKRQCGFGITEVKTSDRKKNQSVSVYKQEESAALLAATAAGARVVAMDRAGKNWSTEQLAGKLAAWSQQTNHYQFLIGGPDGLADECLKRADESWSLSNLTFPHFLVRVLLAEQIYRAMMVNAGHPYHK